MPCGRPRGPRSTRWISFWVMRSITEREWPGSLAPWLVTTASLPSEEAAISWGPSPVGMRAAIFWVAGSRMAREFSDLFRIRSAGEGVGVWVCAWVVAVERMAANVATAMDFIFIGELRLRIMGE